jgi:hypothetical protein
MIKLKQLFLFGTAAFTGAMLLGCSSNVISVNENYAGGTCAALFKITAVPNTPFTKIADSASLIVTAADMDDFVKELTITDSTVSGKITGIPAGKGRLFTVEVYDSLDSLQYKGTVAVDLPRGSTVNVPITLFRIGANAEINGTINESTVIDLKGISNWNILAGTAGIQANKLVIGDNVAGNDKIESKNSFSQPFAIMWYGSFPSTTLSYHTMALSSSDETNSFSFWTRYQDPGKLGFGVALNGIPEYSLTSSVMAVNNEIKGEFKNVCENDTVKYFFNNSLIAKRPFAFEGPMKVSFTCHERPFVIDSIFINQY